MKENAKILNCGADKLYEEDEEDENTKRKREEHEIDLLRWEHGEQAREMHTWHKRQRLMEEDEQRQMAHADDYPMEMGPPTTPAQEQQGSRAFISSLDNSCK